MFKKNSDSTNKKFTTSETIALVVFSLLIGLAMGRVFVTTNTVTKNITTSNKNIQELIKNYEYIINNYYEEIDENKLVVSAINGMMDSLEDPYSMYFDETQTENFSVTLDGSYQGIGIQITENDNGNILVTSVFKDSPAYDAGLKIGDQIIELDEISVKQYTISEFSDIIKKSNKENFKIKILRNEKELSMTIKRNLVTLDSVSSDMYEKNDKKIGYIYIGVFASNTYMQFKDKLYELEKKGLSSLIIDVRGNTGGHLTTVDNILDLFLNKKQKMYGFEQAGNITYVYGTGEENKNYEIVLLGDSTSASASEVLISGLRENLESKFFGKKTYGKGTVQELVTLSDGTQYKLTTKKWLTPNGSWINDSNGIIPDKEVELDEKYFETLLDEDDSQLNYAIEYLINK